VVTTRAFKCYRALTLKLETWNIPASKAPWDFLAHYFGSGQGGGEGSFRTEKAYAQNRATQLAMTPQPLSSSGTSASTNESQLKLEYVFYNEHEKRRLRPWPRRWPLWVTLAATTIPPATEAVCGDRLDLAHEDGWTRPCSIGQPACAMPATSTTASLMAGAPIQNNREQYHP